MRSTGKSGVFVGRARDRARFFSLGPPSWKKQGDPECNPEPIKILVSILLVLYGRFFPGDS